MATTAVVDALVSGRAFIDLCSWRKVAVSGRAAIGWLNDLAWADISGGGGPLSTTGGIRLDPLPHR